MHLQAGDRLGRYEIVSLLGKGGMGEVYRARDAELDREVAIKVLPEEVAADADRLKRFRREAKAVAKLSHSSILEIFDFGEQDDVTYAVTELLEGQSLREKLDLAEGGLPWQKARDIAATVAEGLAVAHGKGVVHRDIKPGNLFLCSDGRVKILDFGLASLHSKVTEDATTASMGPAVSTPGTVLGTVGYMSPEQVRGETADHRSDIFSLGCVLYELLTGRRPFQRDTSVETMTAILREEPRPLADTGVEIGAEMEKTLGRCLEKDPDRRFQSASDLAFALNEIATSPAGAGAAVHSTHIPRRWLAPAVIALAAVAVLVVVGVWIFPQLISTPTGEAAARSIAVLPFDNLSGDPDQEYFADGMTEALITDLSRIGALIVISRTSVMRFKDSELSLPEIALELGVDAVVAGSVQREADQVRITAQLIDAATDRSLWADTFQRRIEGVLELQSEIARAIAAGIAVRISPEEESRLAASREVDPATYEAYLRGMHHLKKGSREGFERGMEYLHEAVDIDPADPLAHAGLANGYVTLGHTSGSAESFKRAKAAARRAFEIDPSLAEAQAALAEVAMYFDWDWDSAELAFQRAIELSPSHAEVHAHYTWLHVLRGDWEEAIAEAKISEELDPLAPAFTSWLGELYWSAGRYEEALAAAEKALELNPGWARAHIDRGRAYLGLGRIEEALAETRIGAEKNPRWKPFLGNTLVGAGHRKEAALLMEELLAAPEGEVNPVFLSSFQAVYGDLDGAMATLERGYETRDGLMPWIGSWFDYGDLQNDPRFQDLLDRLNIEFVRVPGSVN
ncbi:MAG: tetratricopeptide repeat-containing serine/threonine-protein kinase [Thermoanaerobaculales bacterium]|nr:tetratricopeptide repeat-containing serine/threonine-protein kinase [Thermoanaerobaculales bacterium]